MNSDTLTPTHMGALAPTSRGYALCAMYMTREAKRPTEPEYYLNHIRSKYRGLKNVQDRIHRPVAYR